MADGLDHAADLAVAALVDADQQNGIKGLFPDEPHKGGGSQLSVDHDPLAEGGDLFRRDMVGDFGPVHLEHFTAGMENPVHHVSVVGEEEQPLAVVIQTADGEKADRIVRKLVHDGGAAFRIGNRRDLADGLVIGDIVFFFLRTDDFTVHGDRVPGFVHLNAHFGDDRTVHGHAAFLNHFFGCPAGGDAAQGKILLQSDHDRFLSGLFGAGCGRRITGDRRPRGVCGCMPARRISSPPWFVRSR